jgi:hypothetical protein
VKVIRVKSVLVVLTCAALLSACSGAGKKSLTYSGSITHERMTSYQNPLGKPLTWTVAKEDLEASPPWADPTKDPPPLSVTNAVSLSRNEIATYFPDVETWFLEDVALHTLGVEGRGRWFYVVSWRAKGSTGDALGIPVLMSGLVVALTPNK